MALSKRKLSPWFLLALLLILGWVSLQVVGVFLNYVLTGLFLAYISHPAYDWLEKKLKLAPLASMLMVLAVTVVVLVPTTLLLVELVDELRKILVGLDVGTLEARFNAITERFLEMAGRPATEDPGAGPSFFDIVVPSLNTFISRFATRLISVIAEGTIGVFVMLYILYYAYQDGHRFVDSIRSIVPLQEAHRDLLFNEIGSVIKAVMYGHVLTALIQATIGGIGFAIFGVPNVVFWSAVMFVLALLPVIGPPLVWGPWGVYLILSDRTFAGIGLLVYSALMVSTLDNIIRPKLIGDRAHVHPTVVLLGVLGGVVVFGFSGLILGPLVLSIFVTILDVYRKEFARKMTDGVGA